LLNNSPGDSSSSAGRALPDKLAIVFGTESVGCTQEILEAADRRVYLPLRGFADSLNLSVAAALVLQKLFHLDPSIEACMAESERQGLREVWFPKLAGQRALTAHQVREQRRIRKGLQDAMKIRDKASREGPSALTPSQVAKLSLEPQLMAEDEALRATVGHASREAVAKQLANPPTPLADMRRADEHRTAFIGPGVRRENGGFWSGMAATANDNGAPNPEAAPPLQTTSTASARTSP
jgi:hypothetical protein